MLLICVFLVWEVIPLFRAPELSDSAQYQAQSNAASPRLLELTSDGSLGWSVEQDGRWRIFQTANGKLVKEHPADESPFANLQAVRLLPSGELALAKSGGKINVGRIVAKTTFASTAKDIPAAFKADVVSTSEPLISDGKLWTRTDDGLVRATKVETELEPESRSNPTTKSSRWTSSCMPRAASRSPRVSDPRRQQIRRRAARDR